MKTDVFGLFEGGGFALSVICVYPGTVFPRHLSTALLTYEKTPMSFRDFERLGSRVRARKRSFQGGAEVRSNDGYSILSQALWTAICKLIIRPNLLPPDLFVSFLRVLPKSAEMAEVAVAIEAAQEAAKAAER